MSSRSRRLHRPTAFRVTMTEKAGVFISYARRDGEAFAGALRERLLREAGGLRVWQDRPEIEGGVGWWRQVEEALERVEFLVIVMTPAVVESEVTRKEWRAARQSGVCVYPVRGPGFDFADPRLPRWMTKAHVYDLDVQWETFLAHLRRGCQVQRVPFMAPDLPKDYVPRREPLAALRSLLLEAAAPDAAPVTAALAGAGGFGKTTLATALCHDDDIVLALDDGILWTTLGASPNVQGELTRLYAALTGERPGFVSVEDAAQALAEKLEHRNCLIVIDDVWDTAHLKPFLRGGVGCARLITTRQAQVAADAQRVGVDEMTAAEATSLLLARIGERPRDCAPLLRLAQRLGEWPLLLALVGAAMRQRIDRGDSLAGALDYVNRALDRRGITAFDRERAADRHQAVASTVGVSLELLSESDRRRCEELAVFPEDEAVPIRAVGELWGLDEFDTEEVLGRLDSGSLVIFDLRTAAVRLHDVMRAYFARCLGARATEAHQRLLDAWPDARRLPHAYAWRWFGYHLAAAGRVRELAALLGDVDWLRRKLDAVGIQAVISDFHYAAEDARLQVLGHALRLSSHVLAKDREQLVPQLLGRLPESEHDLRAALERLGCRGDWLRPLWPSLSGPGGALMRTLDTAGPAFTLALTDDGEQVLVGMSDGSIAVWDMGTGTLLRTLSAPDGPPADIAAPPGGSGSAFALAPDGTVVLGGSRGLARWDPRSGAPPRPLATIPEGVAALAVSGNGWRVLVGSKQGGLSLWDLAGGGPVSRLKGHRLGVTAVAVSGDGKLGLSGSYDKSVKLWDLYDGSLIDTLYPTHDGVVYAVAMTADGATALSGAGDRLIRVWDLGTGVCRAVLAGHRHRVYALALSRDGKRALSGSHDRTVRLWDVDSGELRHTFEGHADAVYAVAFTPDERFALSASLDRTVRIWQLDAGETRASTQQHDGWIHAAAAGPDGRLAVTAGQDRVLRVWDAASGQVVRVLKGHHDAVSAVALDSGGGRLMSGSHDRSLIVWNLEAGEPELTLQGHADAIAALALAADGSHALSGGLDGQVILWDIRRGRIVRRWDAHRRGVSFVAASPDWDTAVTGSTDGTLRVWSLKTFSCLRTVPAHHDGVTAGALSQAGDLLLSGGNDGTLRLWSFPACELLRTWPGHVGKVRAIGILPHGRLAFSGAYDRYLRLWRLPSADLVAEFATDSAVCAVAASEDGSHIFAGDAQGCVHFLQLEGRTGEDR